MTGQHGDGYSGSRALTLDELARHCQWESGEELDAFLANFRASRAPSRS